MRIEQGFFAVVLGIDGTGKTTTVRRLTETLNDQQIPAVNYDGYEKTQVSNPFSPVKADVKAHASAASQFAYFLGSTLYHSDHIKGLVDGGNAVIKSRYLDDVLAHHAHLGVPNVRAIAALFPVFQPDLRVILTVEEDARRSRVLERQDSDEQDFVVRTPGSRPDFFETFLFEHSADLFNTGRAIHINTTHVDTEQVVGKIIGHLQEIGVMKETYE